MNETDRACLDLASRLLDYPDNNFFANLDNLCAEAQESLASCPDQLTGIEILLKTLRDHGSQKAQQNYVATFDHDPEASLYMAWHRYGNDRGQGKALAALNGLYRAAGLEPVFGSMPDYLPRILEFMAISEEWAVQTMLDGFGPEIMRVIEHLRKLGSPYAPLLDAAFTPLRKKWPDLFKPRNTPDATIRPMARPEPEFCEHSLHTAFPEEK